MSRPRLSAALAGVMLIPLLLGAEPEVPKALNGFSIERHSVPREQILPGGPPRDGIHSVDDPEFATPAEAHWANPSTPVLGVAVAKAAHAYPVHVIEYHQIVNDEIGGVPVVVTFDPLTGTPRAYRRSVAERVLEFGVSGLIFNSSFLLYDRESESLWSQFLGTAISGPLSGKQLERVRVRQESLGAWLERHPDSRVMARPAPKKIDYRYSPFSAYWVSEKVPFPVAHRDSRYHPKELVLGAEVDGASRVYLGSILTEAGGRIVDEFRGRKLRIAYDSDSGAFLWEAPEDVNVADAYWFAWKAFHPDTEIWNDKNPPEAP